jgi:light-regulated signal transduction histidine kinase (bacteriophytochrome)
LSYSRVGTRGNPAKPTDCQQILKTALTDLAIAIEESQAVITSDNLPIIQADELQIRQLFQNLVANAIKFRGTEPPQIHVGVSREDSMWKFHVRDNGIGIKPEFFDRIFVIFQRLHTREEYAGTGIGLALCKRIVERHEGRIWVESIEGKGTTFFFTLPVIREETRPLQIRKKRSEH